MKPRYKLRDKTYRIDLLRMLGDRLLLEIDGHTLDARINHHNRHQFTLRANGVTHEVYAAQDGNSLYLHCDGKHWQLDRVDEFSDRETVGGSNSGEARAPMPGVVVEVNVTPGQAVEVGQPVMLIESMKLQIQIPAPMKGIVSSVYANPGDGFAKGDLLAAVATEEALET